MPPTEIAPDQFKRRLQIRPQYPTSLVCAIALKKSVAAVACECGVCTVGVGEPGVGCVEGTVVVTGPGVFAHRAHFGIGAAERGPTGAGGGFIGAVDWFGGWGGVLRSSGLGGLKDCCGD